MNMRLVHLRIKIKSLASEARIIRAEARKLRGEAKKNLNDHRTGSLRRHARENQLAYGCLRGVPYEVMERSCHVRPDFAHVAALAKRFGGCPELVEFWVGEAKLYLKGERKAA